MPNTYPKPASSGGDKSEAPSALDPYKPLPGLSVEEVVNSNKTSSAHPGMGAFYSGSNKE